VAVQLGAVLLVKVKVADPTATPVTTPLFVTVAIALLLLIQVPPVIGDRVVMPPGQMEVGPVMETVGAVQAVRLKLSMPIACPLVDPPFPVNVHLK